MNLTLSELEAVAAELEESLLEGRIQAVRQPSATAVWLGVRTVGESHGLLLETAHRSARVHLQPERPSTLNPPPAFVSGLRAHLEGARIVALDMPWPDRVLVIRVERGEEQWALVLECSSHHPNLFLTRWDGEIFLALRRSDSHHRALVRGDRYEPPQTSGEGPPAEDRLVAGESPSAALARHFEAADATRDLTAARTLRTRLVRQVVKRLSRAQKAARKDLERARDWPEQQRAGELLKANFHLLKSGLSEVALLDYFDPQQPIVTVALDPACTPQENVKRAFAKARKGRRGATLAEQRSVELDAQLGRATELLAAVEAAADMAELEALDRDLARLSPQVRQGLSGGTGTRKAPQQPRRPYRIFVASTGREIRVGRGGRDNHALTFQNASPHDVWLHVRGFPGSHVVIPLARNQEPDDVTLQEAALLAVHYSKAPEGGYNEVMWTRRKHVRAVRKGAPGQVIVEQEKNLEVVWDQARLDRLVRARR